MNDGIKILKKKKLSLNFVSKASIRICHEVRISATNFNLISLLYHPNPNFKDWYTIQFCGFIYLYTIEKHVGITKLNNNKSISSIS